MPDYDRQTVWRQSDYSAHVDTSRLRRSHTSTRCSRTLLAHVAPAESTLCSFSFTSASHILFSQATLLWLPKSESRWLRLPAVNIQI